MTSEVPRADRRARCDPTDCSPAPHRRASDIADAPECGAYARRLKATTVVGAATHRLIAHLAEAPGARPPSREALTEARRLLVPGWPPVRRLAMRSAVLSLTAVYVERFWIARARLVASELVMGDTAADLVWARPDGQLIVHEIKTGLFAGPDEPTIVAQAEAQAAEGHRLFGDLFAGVNVIVLRRPIDSFLVNVNGIRDT